MSKSLAQKKSDRKRRGDFGKAKTSTRSNGYTQCRAFIPPKVPPDRIGASMLVRSHVDELLRIEIENWHRETPTHDVVVATAVFASGERRRHERCIDFVQNEREAIMEGMFNFQEIETNRKAVSAADLIRRERMRLKQELLGSMQRDYAKGLPCG